MANITLRDVANEAGVTTTTVHRVLHDKPGVSAQVREQVREIAQRLGYTANYMAASLKRGAARIAVALPEPTGESRFFYTNLWQGVRDYAAAAPGIELVEIPYQLTVDGGAKAIDRVLKTSGVSGVLTMAYGEGMGPGVKELQERDVPTVLVGSDLYPEHRFCCVKSCDAVAGRLAAQLLCNFGPLPAGSRVLLLGHFGTIGMADQIYNASGFAGYVAASCPGVEVVHIKGETMAEMTAQVRAELAKGGVSAVYSCSARYTVSICEAAKAEGQAGKVKLIGNDRFDESVALLREGVLSAIIDKKVAQQGRMALKILDDKLIKQQNPASELVRIRPGVLLPASIEEGVPK